jgi:hypothetical protein
MFCGAVRYPLSEGTVSLVAGYGIPSPGTKQHRNRTICRYFVDEARVVEPGNRQRGQAFVGRYGMFLWEGTVCGGA